MARKDLLKGLMEAPAAPAPKPTPRLETKSAVPPRPRTKATGAVGAVSQTIQDLKARAVIDLDPGLIGAGGAEDRVEDDPAADAALRTSIRDHGQQVPVLVRPHPEETGRYQIVYGRRRVLAARDLGLPVKALVRDLDDRALLLAQGQENTARRNLSFIEKANFARQLRDGGYDRDVIAAALTIDKTEISRLLSVADRIAVDVIHAIGSAHGIGRARWLKLADLMEADRTTVREAAAVLAHGETSEARFEALVQALAAPERRRKAAETAEKTLRRGQQRKVAGADGKPLATVREGEDKTVISLSPDSSFAHWLIDQLPDLHQRWLDDA